MSRERNNIRAGVFVLSGVTLIFVGIVVLSDFRSWFTPMQTVEVRFHLADGLKGLKEGASVKIGGVPSGAVVAIIDEHNENGVVHGQIVRFEIPAKYKIYANAHLELDVPVLGSGTALNVRSFGGPIEGAAPAEAVEYDPAGGKPIPGNLAPNEFAKSFATNLGIEDKQRLQMQNIITNIENITAAIGNDPKPLQETIVNLRDVTAIAKEKLPPIADNAIALTDDIKAITADVRKQWPQWAAKIDAMLARLDESAVKLDKALATANAMLDENRANIKDAIASAKGTLGNTEQITERVKTETMEKITKALDTANEAIANMRDTTANLKDFVVAQRPVLERTVGNARIVSDQLKLAAIEIRRSPWRLMYTPTEKELETDNLYDAARSFALAASSLNATADSLQALIDRLPEGAAAEDSDNVRRMIEQLRETFSKFADAEKKFWGEVGTAPKPSKPLDKPAPVDDDSP